MNFQQLEYITALEEHGHFGRAAEACFITQPTLSTMIQKLEEELDIVIFDRSKQPVIPTDAGRIIIRQAKKVLKEISAFRNISDEIKNNLSGNLRIGIIPTLAPYLLPLFLQKFLLKYPQVKIKISEQTTDQIVKGLSNDSIDVGILATPLNNSELNEIHLFYERFLVFVSDKENVIRKKYLLPEDIDVNRLWLLEEGHCLRSQMINLCELRKTESISSNLNYEAGSIESLLKIVEMSKGVTIIPELAAQNFDQSKRKQLRWFKPPVPVREISLVTYRHFVKERILRALNEEILVAVRGITARKDLGKNVIDI